MTQKVLQSAAAAMLVALALVAPPSRAAIVSLPVAATAVPDVPHGLAETTLALAQDIASVELEAPRSAFALAVTPHRRVFEMLRGPSDLALWNLVAAVQAQQTAKSFDLVTTSVKTVWEIEKNHVAPVPLPGVVWLFVLAVLGITGTRVRRAARGAGAMPATA
jgi:hypothetical protein